MDYEVECMIEIPKGSQNKYEYDHERHVFRLDRTLFSPVHYPQDYGFIPQTLAEDGDPIDVLVILSVPTFPGCMVRARVVGALDMTDDKGIDTKILAVSLTDPRYMRLQSLADVPPHLLKEIEYFFHIYKDLEGKQTSSNGWRDRDWAVAAIDASRERYVAAERYGPSRSNR